MDFQGLLAVKDRLGGRVRAAVRREFGHALEAVPFELPPRVELGDLACPLGLQLAKVLKKPPREIAQVLAAAVREDPLVEAVKVEGPGYLNCFLDRGAYLRLLLEALDRPAPPPTGEKVIVEHTNINPNKAAHVGHLRNAVLGDAWAALLRGAGRPVEVQNYIDDTGVQVADLVVGLQELEAVTAPHELEALINRLRSREERFDYYCWDLYARVTGWYEADESRLELRRTVLRRMEAGDHPVARLAARAAETIVRHHLDTMGRLGIAYDLLPWERDIIHFQLWDQTFAALKEAEAIRHVQEGKAAGCWVLDLPPEEGRAEAEKILVKSDGTVTYTGKDIAYQCWKLGLLSDPFHYRFFGSSADGRNCWSTAAEPGAETPPAFGGGAVVYNVIDSRQSYPQAVVREAVRRLAGEAPAAASIHFAYEFVSLSPRTAQALGLEADGEGTVQISGRKGLGVKADDLLDRLEARAAAAVRERNPDFDPAAVQRTARQIMVAALRYFMLRFARNRALTFDLDEALTFEGETGPYLQYAAVRARNIFPKLEERYALTEADLDARRAAVTGTAAAAAEAPWRLVRLIGQLPEAVDQAVRSEEPSFFAKYLFQLAQEWSNFYHACPIAQETDPAVREHRATVALAFRRALEGGLGLLGIAVPARM